jgi:dTDP-4-amino-4,6-dideoxygalactose transaminase
MQYKIPFGGRAHKYTEIEVECVVNAMQNAVPLTQGKYQQTFQEKFSQYTGAKNVFALNNATSGLELAAQLCQFQEGDEVIIPGHTFTSSAYPFLKQGVKIVWADIDLKTRVVSAETIEKCITDKTKAIVVVHLYGYGADMPEIMQLAQEKRIIVVEDAAQALGVEVGGKMVGTFGDFGIYSFHSHKNITTLGEGGMLTVRNDHIAKLIPMLRHNAHCGFDYDREMYWKPAMGNLDMPTLNDEFLLPNNFCLGEVECALGIKLLERIDQLNQEKRQRAIRFINELSDFPQLKFHSEESKRHNYHLLVAQMDNGSRDDFMKKMSEDKGIQCVVQYYPLYRYDFYKKMGQGDANCPNTDQFFDNMISFPFDLMITDEDFELMINASKEVLLSL